MAITYPVDTENTRWAVYQASTALIIARNKVWPVADGGPIQGLDPDYIYLLEVVDAQPAYDARLYSLNRIEGIDIDANILHSTWETAPRALEEVITAIENEESAQMALHVRIEQELKETRLMLGALLFYAVDNQAFPPKALAMSDAYKAKAVKLWQNRDRADELKTAANSGQAVSIDSGWAAP